MISDELNILNEQQVLIRLSNHDQKAFMIIYNTYAKKLFRYAVKIIKSTEIAEDTVHDIFVKLWDNCSKMRMNN